MSFPASKFEKGNVHVLWLFVILLASLATVFGGHVCTELWAWFVAPVFSLPVLTLGQMVGLRFAASCVLGYKSYNIYDSESMKNSYPEDDKRFCVANLMWLFVYA